jgi:hypothetical protein
MACMGCRYCALVPSHMVALCHVALDCSSSTVEFTQMVLAKVTARALMLCLHPYTHSMQDH